MCVRPGRSFPSQTLAAYLEDELHHFSVDQTVDRLPVDVRDEVTRTQSSFLGRTVVLYVLIGMTNTPQTDCTVSSFSKQSGGHSVLLFFLFSMSGADVSVCVFTQTM